MKAYYLIPAGYHNIYMATWKDKYKNMSTKMSILFNQICFNEEMLPKCTYFKLHDPAAYQYNSSLEYRCDRLKWEISLCKENNSTLNLEIQKICGKLESSITHQQLHKLDYRLSIIINKNDYWHKLIPQKKFL